MKTNHDFSRPLEHYHTCKFCGNKYNLKDTHKAYGVHIWLDSYCSSKCYTLSAIEPKKPTLSKQEMIEEVSDQMVAGWQLINSDIVEMACCKYLKPKGFTVMRIT